MGKKGTSGGGTVRTRKDGLKEARLLVPKEYRAAVGRTYLALLTSLYGARSTLFKRSMA
jgi:hypothetical protein